MKHKKKNELLWKKHSNWFLKFLFDLGIIILALFASILLIFLLNGMSFFNLSEATRGIGVLTFILYFVFRILIKKMLKWYLVK